MTRFIDERILINKILKHHSLLTKSQIAFMDKVSYQRKVSKFDKYQLYTIYDYVNRLNMINKAKKDRIRREQL